MIKCYFDGCTEPVNPYGNMGMGAIIIRDNVSIFKHSSFIPASKENSNNVAEYLALEKILIWLSENKIVEQTVFIYGDSKLVINQMNGSWRIKHGLYKDHAIRCKSLLGKVAVKLVFKWIPRELNTIADDLSKAHLLKEGIEFKLQPNV